MTVPCLVHGCHRARHGGTPARRHKAQRTLGRLLGRSRAHVLMRGLLWRAAVPCAMRQVCAGGAPSCARRVPSSVPGASVSPGTATLARRHGPTSLPIPAHALPSCNPPAPDNRACALSCLRASAGPWATGHGRRATLLRSCAPGRHARGLRPFAPPLRALAPAPAAAAAAAPADTTPPSAYRLRASGLAA